MPDMTLDHSGQSATISSRFSSEQTQDYLEGSWGGQRGLRQILERAGFDLRQPARETVNESGLTIEFYRHRDTGDDVYQVMKEAMGRAAAALRRKTTSAGMSGRTVRVYCAAEFRDYSVGYRYSESGSDRLAILVGHTSLEPGRDSPPTLNGTVAHQYFSCDRVNHVQTTILHELGHVLHQVCNLEHYITLANICEHLAGRRQVDYLKDQDGQLRLFRKNCEFLAAGVSLYAYSNLFNEFVAETFAAVAMDLPIGLESIAWRFLSTNVGIPTSEEVLAGYHALGGPPVGNVEAVPHPRARPLAGQNAAFTFPGNAATAAATLFH